MEKAISIGRRSGLVGRQEQNLCAPVEDGLLGDWAFVGGQIVQKAMTMSPFSRVGTSWVST